MSIVLQARCPSRQEEKSGGSGVQGYSQPVGEFKANLGYLRLSETQLKICVWGGGSSTRRQEKREKDKRETEREGEAGMEGEEERD